MNPVGMVKHTKQVISDAPAQFDIEFFKMAHLVQMHYYTWPVYT